MLLVGRDPRHSSGRPTSSAAALAVAARSTSPRATPATGSRAPSCALRPLDILVNNAGTSEIKALGELTDEDWERQWELNVMAPMRLMRAAVPRMADAGWGRIVNVASSSGKRPSPSNAAYSVAKAAELSLSRVYADACAGAGVLRERGGAGRDGLGAVDRPRRTGRAGGPARRA